MRYIIRKFVDAETVEQAIAKEKDTPIHDAYLKEGEEPNRGKEEGCTAIGFQVPMDPDWRQAEIIAGRKR